MNHSRNRARPAANVYAAYQVALNSANFSSPYTSKSVGASQWLAHPNEARARATLESRTEYP